MSRIDLKKGDVVRLKKSVGYIHKEQNVELEIELKQGEVFQVEHISGNEVGLCLKLRLESHSAKYWFDICPTVDFEDVELLQLVETHESNQIEPTTTVESQTKEGGEEQNMLEPFAYSHFVVKRGQRTPRAMLYQAAANQLAAVLGNPEMAAGGVDGITGQAFTTSVEAIQKHFWPEEAPDGVVGKGTWGKMTEALGDWRPPLRWRIAEQQNSFENGGRQNAFGAWNVVKFEGWPNYGLWNCNCMDGNIAGSSIGILLTMAGRKDLWKYDPKQPEVIADFLATTVGRNAQLYGYMNKYVIGPALRNLKIVGIDLGVTAENLGETLDPWAERILALCCDIAVNSGQVGQFATRFPRVWDGAGLRKWDDKLPDQDACIAIYEEVYGIKVKSKTSQYHGQRYSRDLSRKAMRRCVQEVAQTSEEKINLIADLQARCIYARDLGPDREDLQELVLRRRRCVARLGGYNFQGTHYDSQADFGIGV